MKLFSQKLSRAKRSSPLNPNSEDGQAESSAPSTPPQQQAPPAASVTPSKSETTGSKSSGRTQQKRKLYPFNIDRKGKENIQPEADTVESVETSDLKNSQPSLDDQSAKVESFESSRPQFIKAQPPNAVWAVDTEPDMAKKPPVLPSSIPSPSELSRAIAEAAYSRSTGEPITSHPAWSQPAKPHDEKQKRDDTKDSALSESQSNVSTPPSRKPSPPPTTLLSSSTRAADASLTPVNTSAEISNPPSSTSSSSKLRSVPIPQPLLLKRHTSRSSFSSAEDTFNDGSQLSTPSSVNARNALSPTNTLLDAKSTELSGITALSPINSSAGSHEEQDAGSPELSAKSSGNNSPAAAMSPTTGHTNSLLRRKLSYLHDTENGSSASEAEPSDSQIGNADQAIPSAASSFTNDSPLSQHPAPQTNTPPSATASPKYASPPVGSGGRYMLKSKRASWIDANAANPPVIATNFPAYGEGSSGSTPSTPVSGPESIKQVHSRKNSIAEGMNLTGSPSLASSQAIYSPSLAANKEIEENDSPISNLRLHKTGSLSRISESGTKSISTIRRRESSIDFPSSGSEGSSRFADTMSKRLPRRSSTLDSTGTDPEDGMESQNASSLPPPYSLPSGYRDILHHKRTPSISSTLTTNSIDELSPLVSPAVRMSTGSLPEESSSDLGSPAELRTQIPLVASKSLASSRRERTASSSSSMSMSSTSTKVSAQTKAHRRRSSMSMLRKIPTEELANIVSGSSPNPVITTPMSESFTRQRGRTHTIATSNLSSFQSYDDDFEDNEAESSSAQGQANSLPLYQNSLHSLLKRQFHAHADQSNQSNLKRSSSLADRDRDVTEMRLDDEDPNNGHAERNREAGKGSEIDANFRDLRAPIFPSSLLNNPYPMSASKKSNKKFLSISNARASTSAPHLLQDTDDLASVNDTQYGSSPEPSKYSNTHLSYLY